MRKKKLSTHFIVALMMTGIMFTGCEIKDTPVSIVEQRTGSSVPVNSSEDTGEQKTDEWKPLTITWYVHYDWFQVNGVVDLTERYLAQWLKDNRGVTVSWVSSNGAAAQRLSIMMASGDLPDVITLDRGTDVDRLAKAGKLVDLEQYFGKYPVLKNKLGKTIIEMLRSEDGKLYQLPNWYIGEGGRGGNAGWVVNTKIYREMGSPKLETFTDLEKYLKAVKEKYPDIIPLESGKDIGALHLVYSGMGEKRSAEWSGRTFWYPDGNQLKSVTEDLAWKDAVLFVSRLFREKLITQDAMTQTSEQVDEKFMKGSFAVTGGWSMENIGNQLAEWKKVDPEAGYHAVMPFYKESLDKDNIYVTAHNSLGWNVTVITKKAEDPEAIYKLFDWVASDEGQIINTWGPPGVYWDGVDDKGYPKFTERWSTDTDEVKETYTMEGINWFGDTNFVNGIKTKMVMEMPEDVRPWGTWNQVQVFWKTTWEGTEFTNLEPSANTEEGLIFNRIEEVYNDYYARILFAESDSEVESLIQECNNEMKQAGQDKLLEYQTRKWLENRKKLGLD